MVVFWVRYSDSHDLVVGLQYLLDSLLSHSSPSPLQLMIDSSPGHVASILVLSLDQKNSFNIRTLNYFILEIFRNFRSRICKNRTHPRHSLSLIHSDFYVVSLTDLSCSSVKYWLELTSVI